MRLFVAVDLDAPAVAAAQALAMRLRRRCEAIAPAARITWVPAERLHLTLAFIGHVDDTAAGRIAESMRPPIDHPPFPLTFRGAGAFPSRGAPRVLWMGISAGLDELRRLERDIGARLAAVGFPDEARPFHPHLTLARVREAAGLNASSLAGAEDHPLTGTTQVDAITLYESRSTALGPTYVAIQRSPLVAA